MRTTGFLIIRFSGNFNAHDENIIRLRVDRDKVQKKRFKLQKENWRPSLILFWSCNIEGRSQETIEPAIKHSDRLNAFQLFWAGL